MSTITDNDLRELKDLINSKFEQVDRKFEQVNEKIDSKFEKVFEEFTAVKVEIATIKSDVNGLGKRLDNLEFIARSMIIGILVTLVSAVIKFLYPNLLS
jgi:polyhydroxyalkanoate synthesis regulator phasin